MAQPVIEVERLSKRYQIGAIGASSIRDSLERWWDGFRGARSRPGDDTPGGSRASDPTEYWALRDATFSIFRGDVVGIVGNNGAGKSTILKLLSRITEPTYGRAVLRGRVASLLEVGTGFHPDLTGRDNVYMNGAILGMRIAEIDEKFDDIVDFAEIGRFIDTPVKRYSSGMYVRLAFAVAAHLQPEILLIDEVLAVGDAAFQKRCLGKMGDLARDGRTILFVSHNMAAVQALCKSTVWLERGSVKAIGDTRSVLASYMRPDSDGELPRGWKGEADSNRSDVSLEALELRTSNGDDPHFLTVASALKIVARYRRRNPALTLSLSLQVTNESGVCVFVSPSSSGIAACADGAPASLYESECQIPAHLLNEGTYSLTVHFVKNRSEVIRSYENLLRVVIHDDPSGRDGWYGTWAGIVRPRLEWKTFQVDDGQIEGET
jgi:lipopolysaccharide transport system ATP-binding protein